VIGVEEFGGTDAEQVEFVHHREELMEGLDIRLAIWPAPHDVGTFETPAFKTISLRANPSVDHHEAGRGVACDTR